jgi:pseudoazurin
MVNTKLRKSMKITKSQVAGLAAALMLISGATLADESVVTAKATAFDPMVIFIKPGDTVKWTTMAGHDTASVAGMIPEGAQAWQSKLGEEFSVTLDKEGAYIYKCTPHVSQGMLGAIVVGEGQPKNLEQIHANPENKGMVGRAVKKLDQELKKKSGQK